MSEEKQLFGLELINKVIEIVLWTGWVKNAEKPVSLLTIAPPEEGKTRLVEQYRYNKGIVYITDVTAYGLSQKLIQYINEGKPVNHIIIPDLLNPLSRQKSVSDTFILFLNALIEEGIAKIKTGSILMEIPMKAGVITTLTTSEWYKHKDKWISIGFLSRLVPLTYRYSRNFIMELLEQLSGAEPIKTEINLNFPEEKVHVTLPRELHRQLKPYAIDIAKVVGLDGIRMYRDLGIMLKGFALSQGRDYVTQADVDVLKYLTNYINYDFNLIDLGMPKFPYK